MPKPKVVYRLAKRLDCGHLEELNQVALPVFYSRFEWESMVSMKRTYLVTVSAELVGYMACNTDGCVISFAVAEKFRRKGYGRALLKYGLEELKKTGIPEAILRVKVINKPALMLYEAMGFVVIQGLPNYYSKGDHGYLMRCPLSLKIGSTSFSIKLWR